MASVKKTPRISQRLDVSIPRALKAALTRTIKPRAFRLCCEGCCYLRGIGLAGV